MRWSAVRVQPHAVGPIRAGLVFLSDILNTSSVRLLGEQRLKGMPNVPMLSELPGLSRFNVRA